jgi:hypothetical protein
MASQRPIVATDLATHTQVLDQRSAVLVAPTADGLARGIGSVLEDARRGQGLAAEAARLVEANYSMPAYRRKVAGIYSWVEEQVRSKKART